MILLRAMILTATIWATWASEAAEWPGDRITDEKRAQGIQALKDAYRMNNDSMIGWGSYDMPKIYGPPIPYGPQFRPKRKEGGNQ